jgi:hypothetical protein
MATYYVYSGAAGTNAGTSWTNAYTALALAVTAATTAGDIIKVHCTHQEEVAVDTTYGFGASQIVVVSVDKDSSDAYTPMGSGGWVGNSTTNRSIALVAANRMAAIFGMTFRVSGTSLDSLSLSGDGCDFRCKDVRF